MSGTAFGPSLFICAHLRYGEGTTSLIPYPMPQPTITDVLNEVKPRRMFSRGKRPMSHPCRAPLHHCSARTLRQKAGATKRPPHCGGGPLP